MLQIDLPAYGRLCLSNQEHDVALFLRDEDTLIDPKIDYSLLPGLSHEVRQRLDRHRPATLVSLCGEHAVLLSLTIRYQRAGSGEASGRCHTCESSQLDEACPVPASDGC